MCLLVLYYHQIADAPIVLAANRDEAFRRPSSPPRIQAEQPRIVCGTDILAGGTWLGVNEQGLVVSVTNRNKSRPPAQPRSRGTLCRELLTKPSAASAAALAECALRSGGYAGANYLCVDADRCYVISASDEIQVFELVAGVHLLANQGPNDVGDARQQLLRRQLPDVPFASGSDLLAALASIFSSPADENTTVSVVRRGPEYGTVSSTLLALTAPLEQSIYRYADGPPDRTPYADYSSQLREILAPNPL